MILEDIGEADDDGLLCMTDQPSCCHSYYTDNVRGAIGNWFFPNGTRIPGTAGHWDLHRTRGHMVVRLHRRRGGAEGIYRCEIPDAKNVIQTIYIGVYDTTGKPLPTH